MMDNMRYLWWEPVDRSLPPFMQHCLLYDGYAIERGYLHLDGTFKIVTSTDTFRDADVTITHWMRFPDPPLAPSKLTK